jgi:3-phenylpropionate/trans-cinnamate dioxygenase ferredoxin subunit
MSPLPRSDEASSAARWLPTIESARLAEGGRWLLKREGHDIALFRIDGRIYAIADGCPHAGASLATGKLDGTTVSCRAHGLRFDLASGRQCGVALGLQARRYAVREADGRIEVDLGPAAPAGNDAPASLP